MRIGLNGWFYDQPQVGSGQYVRHLCEHLAAREDLSLVLFRPVLGQSGRRSPRRLASDGRQALGPFPARSEVSIPLRDSTALAKLWYEQAALPRLARGYADILHYPYFAAPLARTCPVVVTILDVITFLYPEYSSSPQVKLYNVLIALAARRAHAIIAISEHTRRDVIRHLRILPERVHVVYLAADPAMRPPQPNVVAATKHRYGLDRYVFYMGGLNKHKNVGVLVKAYAHARSRLSPGCQLVIAGQPHSPNPAIFPDMRPLIRALNMTWNEGASCAPADVRFLGFVPEEDKPALYAGADVFAYPSLYEGFGLCPLEAMACGSPVVSSRAASLPEVVGDAGILVDPEDIAAMADAIVGVQRNQTLAAMLQAKGLRQAARFSWERTAEQTIGVYRNVLSARGVSAGRDRGRGVGR